MFMVGCNELIIPKKCLIILNLNYTVILQHNMLGYQTI